MKVFKKVFCRCYQFCFRLVMPILPYRRPIIYNSVSELEELFRELEVRNVMLITDEFLRKAGVTKELEELLSKKKI